MYRARTDVSNENRTATRWRHLSHVTVNIATTSLGECQGVKDGLFRRASPSRRRRRPRMEGTIARLDEWD